MKRLIVWSLALMLVLSALPALAQSGPLQPLQAGEIAPSGDAKLQQMAQVVQAFIDGEGYTSFLYDANKARFSGLMSMDTGFREVDVDIYLYEDSLAVYVSPSGFRVEPEHIEQMAVLASLINWEEFYAGIYLDVTDGGIMAGSIQVAEEAMPTVNDMITLVHQPIWLMEDYGPAILQVNQGADAQEAFTQIRNQLELQNP